MLEASYNSLITVLKVQNRMVVRVSVAYPREREADWELGPAPPTPTPAPASQEGNILHIANPGDQNSKSKVFLPNAWCSCTITESKNHNIESGPFVIYFSRFWIPEVQDEDTSRFGV